MTPEKDRALEPAKPRAHPMSSQPLELSSPWPVVPLWVHLKRFIPQMIRWVGAGSVPATVGGIWRSYLRWCRIEGNQPHAVEAVIDALRKDLREKALWPDALAYL